MDLFSISGGVTAAPPFARVRLDGTPIGKGRARGRIVTPKYGKPFISFYTPAETRDYEDALKILGKIAMRGKKATDAALAVRVTATMPVPSSWSNKKRDQAVAGILHPTGKPDADNIIKILDAMNKVVWTDDSRIVRALVIKQYGERPSLLVEVYLM